MPATSAGVDGPPRWARPFVWTLLAAVLLCGVAGVEAWPFSAFHLFSQVRTARSVTWRLTTVDHAGHEHALAFRALPSGYRGVNLDLGRAVEGGPAARAALCSAMVAGARRVGRDVAAVRVYAVDRDLAHRVGRRSTVATHLAFSCDGKVGARAHG